MKMYKYFLILLSFLIVNIISISVSAFAQGFNSITTPDGTNLVAVGNSGKLYRSVNGGSSWFSYTIAGNPNLYGVTSFGNDVWIAGQNGNVYKTLKTVSSSTPYNVGSSVNLNSVSFVDANTGYVCGDGGVVYKTMDGGLTWSASNSGIAAVKLNSIRFKDASTGTVVGNGGNVYVTVNGGSSWSSQSSGTARNLLSLKNFNDSLVAVGEYGTLILNTGSGWTPVAMRIHTDIRGIAGTSMNDVHVCGGGGFIRNNRSGSSKFLNFEQNPMMANLVDIFYYDNNKGWAVSSLNSVIIYTTNGGTTWSMPAGSTVSYSWVSKLSAGGGIGNNLCEHPNDRNSMFVVYGSTVYVSRDRGETWTTTATIPSGSNAHSFYVSPIDTNIWMCAIESSPDKVVRSTNHGANWTTILSLNFSNYGMPLEMDQNNPSTYYFAPDGGGFWKSTDNGASFAEISGNYPFRSPCDIIVMWDSSSVIYLADGITGSGAANVFKSTNGGVNWSNNVATASSEVPCLGNSVFDRSFCYATNWGGGQLYKTTDYGNTWPLLSTQSSSGWGIDVCHEDPSLVLKGTYGSPTWLSTNSGANFNSTAVGGGAGAGIIVPDRGYLIAMQTSGLLKMSITFTDSPVLNTIDVQALSLGALGANYYASATITPSGTVRNNNGSTSATFTVTRKITPGGYVSTKNVINLGASSTATVNFDPWTFNSGTTYTVKDSVSISGDTNPGNDVLSGSITPFVGQSISSVNETFAGAFPPAGWTFQFSGTNYWIAGTASAYGNGIGSAIYDFWNAATTTGSQSLFTPVLTASIAGDSLQYDYAYSPYSGATDSLIIETSTNGGTSYTTLQKLHGKTSDVIGASNSIVTTAVSSTQFTPTSGQWLTRKWSLPVGTNKIKFRARSGFGNDLYMDNISVTTNTLFTQYNLKLAPQGLYNGSTLNIKDTVRVYLRNIVSPFSKIDSSTTVLDSSSLTAACVFKNAPTGTYYFQALHRNAIEEWSKTGGETFTKGVTSNFDFTSSQSQAFGSNMIFVINKWCFFSGDVNSDGTIDLTDIINIFNDAGSFVSGYVVTDLNGDLTTDLSDIIIGYNNSSNFVSKITPETSPSDVALTKDRLKKQMIDFKNKNTGEISNPVIRNTNK